MSWYRLLWANLAIRSGERQARKAGTLVGDSLLDKLRERFDPKGKR